MKVLTDGKNMQKDKTIAILSTFYSLDPGYSLCAVVRDQLFSLVKNGYKTIFCVLPSFKDDALVPNGVEIRKIVPQLILEPYKGTSYPSHWKEDLKKANDLFEKNLQDVDYLICHDIFFIDTFLPYNIALRESNLKCQFLAWTHSAPSTRPVLTDNPHANRYTLPLRTKLVYLNHDKANDLAEMYGAWLKDVRVVHNARDPRTFWDLDPLVNRMIDKYSLFEADIISVYPLSTPRMISGKGLDKVIKIHSKLKQLGYKTRLIVCNAHANAQPEQRLIAETRNWAAEMKIYEDELIFTSQEGKEYELGVKSKIVSDLFRLSNIFIFPTTSENSSLVLLEAMLSGNLLVLNKKVGTLLEHAGENALYFDFDYREPLDVNENYYLDLGKIIASQFEVNKSLQVKRRALQKHNYDYIFSHELENLLYENE
jgi:glycosyltransferase involved in cell wall biosynthesis